MMFKNSVKLLGLLGVLSLLSGCMNAHEPKDPQNFKVETPAQRQAEIAKVKFWRVEGAFSIVQTDPNAPQPVDNKKYKKPKPEVANFHWDNYNQNQYRLRIYSALGLYQVQINYQFHIVKLWKNGTHVYTARTPEGLMKKALGWSLPISELRSWIKSVPAKNGGCYEATYDKYGHLTHLEQAGWTVDFNEYRTNMNGIDFARSITMSRPGFVVTIAITRWFWYMDPYGLPDVKG